MKYIITLSLLSLVGCKCLQCEEPKFEPLPPEKLHELLHISENYAYKSVTKKDYEQKDFN